MTQTLVEKPDQDLVAFDPIMAEIAKYKKVNADLVFNITTEKGEKEARSHVYSLRKVKTQLESIRKDAKAEFLAGGRKVDAKGKVLHAEMDEMIDLHWKPIRAKEVAANKIAFEKAEAHRIEREADEAERIRKITEAEEKIAQQQRDLELAKEKVRKQAEQLEYEANAQEREKQATVDAEAKAESDRIAIVAQAKIDQADAVQAEKDKQADEAAEAQHVAAMEAEVEAERVGDKDHRKKIEQDAKEAIFNIRNVANEMGQDFEDVIIQAIIDNEVPNVTLNY